jgi:hypothetical protein
MNVFRLAQDPPENLFAEPTPVGQAMSILWFLLGAFFIFFYFWMLVDTLARPIKNKALWFVVVLVTGPIGAIIYFFTGRKQTY